MKYRKVEVGMTFGEWAVIEKYSTDGRYYRCKCSCGQERVVFGGSLRAGKSKSCGHVYTDIPKDQRKWAAEKKCRYGISYAQTMYLLNAQNNKCAICHNDFIDNNFCIDHDHITNKVRGLLCTACNHMLGKAKDSIKILEAGVEYLRQHSTMDSDSYDI